MPAFKRGIAEYLKEIDSRIDEDVMEFYLGITEKGGKKSFAEVKHYKRRKRWLS